MTVTLMVGVSGIRGIVGKDLTDEVVGRYARAFGRWAKARTPVVVVGRDARESGPAFERAVVDGLGSVGCAVVKVGLVPTPTVQLAVEHHAAGGGIAITPPAARSEEHTSELQSRLHIVCRLLLDIKRRDDALDEPVGYF